MAEGTEEELQEIRKAFLLHSFFPEKERLMPFVSFNFLAFLLFTLIVYHALPRSGKSMFLAAASFFYYLLFKPEYALVLASVIAAGYAGARWMGNTASRKNKRWILLASLAAVLGTLFLFKYYTFFSASIESALSIFHINAHLPYLHLLLPIGLSFYSLTTLGYLIDVYRGTTLPEKDVRAVALLVSFFPLVTSGPIERASRILPQLRNPSFDQGQFLDGLKLMAWGYFKKAVIADNLGVVVDRVYGNVTAYDGPSFIVATFFFTLQIFADFSGYTDIAIGAAQAFGIRIAQNFNLPYYAESLSDFWKRWHISLSTWLRDYLYIPLVQSTGRRLGQSRFHLPVIKPELWTYGIGVLVTFFLCGLWHGANWTYVAWGMIHGFYLIFGRLTLHARERMARCIGLTGTPKLYKILKVTTNFCLVSFAWIFFRANSPSDAWYIVQHLFSGTSSFLDAMCREMFFSFRSIDGEYAHIINLEGLSVWLYRLGIAPLPLVTTLAGLLVMELVHFAGRKRDIVEMLNAKPLWMRWAWWYLILFYTAAFGKFDVTEFFYARF
jgi:alginate O-acetyltransferase complex protein AlgI